MTTLTRDLLSAYGIAIAREATIASAAVGELDDSPRWIEAKTRVRETRARLIDHLEKLEEMATAAKGRE